jgi:hypothetical protein
MMLDVFEVNVLCAVTVLVIVLCECGCFCDVRCDRLCVLCVHVMVTVLVLCPVTVFGFCVCAL